MKFYELKAWDKAMHGDTIDTFIKMDWMYAHWQDGLGNMKIWHYAEYELKDWIYYPITQ